MGRLGSSPHLYNQRLSTRTHPDAAVAPRCPEWRHRIPYALPRAEPKSSRVGYRPASSEPGNVGDTSVRACYTRPLTRPSKAETLGVLSWFSRSTSPATRHASAPMAASAAGRGTMRTAQSCIGASTQSSPGRGTARRRTRSPGSWSLTRTARSRCPRTLMTRLSLIVRCGRDARRRALMDRAGADVDRACRAAVDLKY